MRWPCWVKSLFSQCFWRKNRPPHWSPVRREMLGRPPWSRLAWRGFAPMRKPGSISKTHIARLACYVFPFHFKVQTKPPYVTHSKQIRPLCARFSLIMFNFSSRTSSGLSTLVSYILQESRHSRIHYLYSQSCSLFRWRPVCWKPLQEWSHVFRQCRRLWLRLQVRFYRDPLWKRCVTFADITYNIAFYLILTQ